MRRSIDASKTPSSLKCAVRALRKEIIGFRFSYPLQVVIEAGPRESLHYYMYSDALSWEALRLDSAGIPRAWYRSTGAVYWPAYVAWYGLVHLGHFLRRADETSLAIFLRQAGWLENYAVLREDQAIVWPMNFDYDVGTTKLVGPWISSHAQGLVISALIRAWRLTRRPRLLELLTRSARVFELDVEHRGLQIRVDGGVLYTEVPGGPSPGILDGFLISLLALYDLWSEFGDQATHRLLVQGLDGLEATLPAWNYRNKWSWYGCREYLCTPAYHHQNRILLSILARLSGRTALRTYADRWDPARLSTADRAEIFFAFALTKNASRFRHRTWRIKQH